jgi:membrane fusion protein (multidrug efflux system)
VAENFSRTLRSLRADRLRPWLMAISVLIMILVIWGTWFLLAQVNVYELSLDARIEVISAVHTIGAPVSGRITAVNLKVDQQVAEGDVLVTLETSQESSRVDEEMANLNSLRQRRQALQIARQAEIEVGTSSWQRSIEVVERARAELHEEELELRLATATLERNQQLIEQGVISQAGFEETQSIVDQEQAEVEIARRQLAGLEWEKQQSEKEHLARLAENERQLAAVDGEIGMAEAAVTRLSLVLEERAIRAPVAGRIGELEGLKPGSVVEGGDPIAAIVPEGELMVVARFPAGSALGRIRAGQEARLRLDAFPWIRFGEVKAVVARVGSEAVDGLVRVEAGLAPEPEIGSIPLQHGLVGSLAVKVEQVAPVELLLRVVGKRLDRVRQAPVQEEPEER